MLLVRVLDGRHDRQEALVFVLAENGELGALSGEIGLVEPESALSDATGAAVTRHQPGPWLDALARRFAAEGRYELEVREVAPAPGAATEPAPAAATEPAPAAATAPAPGAATEPAPGAATEPAPAAATASTPEPARRRGRRPLLGGLVLLCIAAVGVGAWRTDWFGSSSSGQAPAAPIRALAAASRTPALAPPTLHVDGGSAAHRRLARATETAVRELLGVGGASPVAFDTDTGLWDFAQIPGAAPSPTGRLPTWWQSATAMDSVVRYASATRSRSPSFQRLLSTVFDDNVAKPGTFAANDFENGYMDDTAWWGLAWADAARYELRVRHDRVRALRYLRVAEHDARHIARQSSRCGTHAIPFRPGWPPNTITDAEFVDLTARLARMRSPGGGLVAPQLARRWSADARGTLRWLKRSHLIDLRTGSVYRGDDGSCRPTGPAQVYTEGEVADALTRVGALTHDPVDTNEAAVFINHVLDPASGMLAGGVLQNPCEASRGLCAGLSYNITFFSGVFDEAVSDWSHVTHSTAYDAFVTAQARAVLADATGLVHGACSSPADCQLSMYWARRVPEGSQPLPPNAGSQAAGVAALTDALVLPGGG
jgi:hypothetical protein